MVSFFVIQLCTYHDYCYCILRDFTSIHTIRVESGLAHIMDQYDKKTKIRRILGEINQPPSNNATPTGAMLTINQPNFNNI